MSDDATSAVCALRCERVDGAFEAVEHVTFAGPPRPLRFDPTSATTSPAGRLPAPISAAAVVIGDRGYLVGRQETDRAPLATATVITASSARRPLTNSASVGNDHNRAFGVLRDLLTHRTQEQARETAAPAGTDDDQVGGLRDLEQCPGR